MSPLDAFWHLANLFAPAWGLAALLAAAAHRLDLEQALIPMPLPILGLERVETPQVPPPMVVLV